MYNNHHVQYGYLLYAAAVVAKFNPSWERHWRWRILPLARDYGNPSQLDPSFPPARHKDWFLGLSWDGGISPTLPPRTQASSGEALNSYYALYVYGSSINSPYAKSLQDFD